MNVQGERSFRTCLVAAIVLAGAMCCLGVVCGITTISPFALLSDSESRSIAWQLRIPRVALCFVAGAGLSIVGAAYQAIFRNPLASPFSLGVSSGAALGASLALMYGSMFLPPAIAVPCFSAAGALTTIFFILGVGRSQRGSPGPTLILLGVVLSFFCSSLLTLLQYLSDYSQLFRVTRWMMGGIMIANPLELSVLMIWTSVVTLWLFTHHRDLDLMLFGDEFAASKGVNVAVLYRSIFLLTSLLVGGLVALCGVVGFVGILIPCIGRLLVGTQHRRLLPLCFLLGGSLVVACDILGRVLVPPYEIPVGVFTAVLGGPVFVFLLIRSKGGYSL